MSMTKSVLLVAKTLILPLVPAGTMASFPTTPPLRAFSVATTGSGWPAGQVVRYPNGPGATTVMRIEYAFADEGIPQVLERIGKFRVAPATSEGGPLLPVKPLPDRVSASRHGVTG